MQSAFNKRLLCTWSTLEAMYTSSSRHRHVGLAGVDSSTAGGLREAWLLRRHGPGYGPGPRDLVASSSNVSANSKTGELQGGTELTDPNASRKASLRAATISLRPREHQKKYVSSMFLSSRIFKKVGLSSRMQLVS